MQSRVHQLQQQLAALLSAALPQSISNATNDVHAADAPSSPSLTEAAASGIGINDSARIAALESCRRSVLYPPNAPLLPHCAHFLSQGFTQLLADKSYGVRHAAAVAYGSLCAILVSTAFSSNVLSNHVLAGSLVDRFLAWALPSFHDFSIRNNSTELALDSLQEFLSAGNAVSVERYVPSILKASQELLEDERTSFSLFNQLLSLLTLISSKFVHCFQPHFFDIVDLLLGWTFMPELPDSERSLITDSFFQFQKHWLSNLQFSLSLLSKLLGDAEVLMNDVSIETTPQHRRLISLFSCFSTILQSIASGTLEMNLLDHVSEPLENLTPMLLRCTLVFGKKFGWSKWMGGSWKCLVLIAEILLEKFSHYYPMVIDVLFHTLREVTSDQVLILLKTNLKLLSLQKLGLLPSSVQILLKFHSPLSQLRLHSNHSIVASSAATYLFFLQHGSCDIVSHAITYIFEELEQLKCMLAELRLHVTICCQMVGTRTDGKNKSNLSNERQYSELDLLSLLKFDLEVLSSTISVDGTSNSEGVSGADCVTLAERSARVTSFILNKLVPFEFPIEGFCELQVHVIRTLCKLSEVEFLVQLAGCAKLLNKASVVMDSNDQPVLRDSNKQRFLANEYLRKFSGSMARALTVSLPLGTKLEGLGWIRTFTLMVLSIKEGEQLMGPYSGPYQDIKISDVLFFSILDAAFDGEVKVRYQVASVLELLLQAGLIHPENFCFVSKVVLNRLTDPEMSIKTSYVRLLSISVPLTLYIHGITDDCYFWKLKTTTYAYPCYLNWKKALALKTMHRKLHSQQFLSVFSYLSQRLKAPLSYWIRRLMFSCHGRKDRANQQELIGGFDYMDVCKDSREEFVHEKIYPINNLAAIWWSIHEAARYCIDIRLRTTLGGPTQTFASLERMLCDIPSVLQVDFEPNNDQHWSLSNFHLLPVRLLLDFVECLKKNVYNACDGSSILPSTTGQSSLFFRTNKKVCEEWFFRICEPMLNAGMALNYHDATFYSCVSRLQDLRNPVALAFRDKTQGATENFHNLRNRFAGDIMKILQRASLALCKIHEPEALIGLQKCVGQMFPSLFMDNNHTTSSDTGTNLYFSWMTGLVYQARGQYEKAAAHFSHLLQSDEALGSMGSDGIQFVIARVIESYTSLSDWKSLETWLSELQALRSIHAGKAYSGALTASGNEINAIHALARFDEGEVQSAWTYLDLTPKHSCQLTLDPTVAFERSEQMLLRSMLQRETNSTGDVLKDLEKAKAMLDEALSIIPLDGLNEAAACAAHLHCIFVLEECMTSSAQHVPSVLTSLSQLLHLPISTIHQDISLWIKIFRIYHTVKPTSVETMLLGQRLLSLARKQTNFMLAERLIQNLKTHSLSTDKHSGFLGISLQFESILLKYAKGKPEEALLDLWTFVRDDFLQLSSPVFTKISHIKAKACLKLSSWMARKSANMNLRTVLSKIYEDLILSKEDGLAIHSSEGFLFDNSHNSNTKRNAIVEEIIGTATKLSCALCPQMGKAWLSYAAWCFAQGRSSLSVHGAILQSCSLTSILKEEISPVRFELTKDEISKVKAVVANICSSRSHAVIQGDEESGQSDSASIPEFDAFLDLLVHETACIMELVAGAPSFGTFDSECPSSVLFSQLQALFLRTLGIEKSDLTPFIAELIDIWWLLRQRRVWLFGHAAHGYFEFLSHSSYIKQESKSTNSHFDSRKGKIRSCILQAMLYLLTILINYGVELEETFNHGFATVAPLPWQEITPQLFAQLRSHPKKAVREQVQSILMMLAKISPCSIVYPLLVDVNTFEGQSSEELQSIYSYLNNLDPKLIQEVRLVVNELDRISVLWEEQWLSALQDLHTDVARRINILKDDAARIEENTTLSHAEKKKITGAKYSALMAPIIVALERRLESTSCKEETVHELWFQKEYGKQLKSAILSFKIPPASASVLGDVWQAFDAIAASLVNYQRTSSICLSEVAPNLALLSSSSVPMPGLERQSTILDTNGCFTDFQGIITVSSFNEQVGLLTTKTRPKKLVLLGSDGQKYTYLLKGREDLRLDARIMQLLQAINCCFASSADSLGQSLGVRYYSVTPISGQAGLIQWVERVTSIYSVYKSWQNHNQLSQLYSNGGMNSNPVPAVLRPSDMFYGKIIPALKEKGIRRVVSRRDWPHEVKRKVLLDLMQETPRQLLWQELWCASEGFKSFHSKIRRFSWSVAAMSIIGHVVGLGDRHLDNILIDFSSGEVVHIDYNVCFDKGRRLKIPEIVPFRLTQTIEAALGLTGVEGVFRANCETVINLLRKNKDIVIMLLEVFVWDPLVEWTREDPHDKAVIAGEEKKGMELAVSLSLFASRFQEIRVPLQEHHDLLASTLPAAESALKRFLGVLIEFEVVSAIFYHADKERSRLLQHETTAKSIAAEASCFSEKSRAYFEAQALEYAQGKSLATEKAQEVTSWIEEHGRVLDALRSHSFLDSEAFIKLGSMDDSLSLTSAVLILGVPLTVVPESTQAHCSDLDGEISRIIAGLDNELSSAVDALNEYGLILQQILPLNYVVTSPFNRLAQVLELSVNNPSADVLSLARKQAADIVSSSSGTALDSLQKKHQDLLSSMEMHAMEIETFDKERSKLLSLIESDSEPKAKERLLSAFTKLMQPEGHGGREDDSPVDDFRDFKMLGNLHKKKGELLFLLNMAVSDLYKDVKEKLASISKVSGQRISWKTDDSPLNDSSFISTELEVHIEKCILLTGLLHEVQNFVGKDLPSFNIDSCRTSSSEHDWTTDFHVILHSVKMWFENFTECVLAEIIEAFVFCNTEVMETLASLSQIRGSIDTALQKLVEVELERESLMELEKSYFMKVEIITEQQLALQEAASRDHDHLSWEEAEELANQVESCRTQLEQLHQSWNQKDVRIAALARIDASIMNSLASLEGYFSSLVDIETNGASQSRRSNSFLAALVKPFTELESIDLLLSSYLSSDSYLSEPLHTLSDLAKSGFSLSDSVWMFPYIIKKHSLFIWKVGIIDSIINSLIFDVSASFDHSLGLYQLSSIFRKKLEVHLQKYHCQYLKEKVILALLAQLDKVDENLRQMIEAKNDFIYKITMDDSEPLRSVRLMLEEYCIAQETARAARSAANAMKEHVKQRTEALYKTVLEIFRIEWLHEKTVPQVLNTKVYLQNAFGDNKLACLALKTNRSTLLEKMLSSISSMAGSLEHLQAFEKTSTSAEAQIERALGWVYAGPNIVGSGNSPSNRLGIPPEFHDHLLRRRKLLWKAHEQASDIIKFCTYVIEFEASRESFFWTNEETKAGQILDDSHTLKQSSLIALTRLDNSYQSFARAEQEWKLSQDKMEAAAKSVLSATNELCIASGKVKSASSDLQQNIATLRECVYEASLALSSFCSVSKEHIALASECGSILEEVLVITESLHDVYGYAKEASMMHKSFMADLSQAMIVLLPLEASLSSDVASMTNTKSKEKESSIDVSPIHGEGLYQSYCFRLQETCQILESLVPSITFSVKELYSMLAKLARAASIHAGNLNKALEGVADSEVVISQEISLSRPDFLDGMHANENINLGPVEGILFNDTVPVGEFTSDDEGWISPPDCSYTSSQAFSLTAIDTEEDSNDLEQTRLPNSSRSNISRQETLSHEKSIAECINNDAHSIQSSSSVPPILGKIEGSTVNNSLQMLTIEEVTSVDVIPSESLSPSRGLEGSYEDPIGSNPLGLLKRGKNAYAMSALRQIEYKIEGRDIEDGRIMQASLLVDHLIKEATNIDNLCNMYEGWTPWI